MPSSMPEETTVPWYMRNTWDKVWARPGVSFGGKKNTVKLFQQGIRLI